MKKIVDPGIYMRNITTNTSINGSYVLESQLIAEPVLMIGQLSALGGSGIWLIIATFLKFPVSASHSIVGAMLGMSLVSKGNEGISWVEIGKIVGSWFASPILSGIISVVLFLVVRKFILNTENILENGLRFLPIFYAFTLFVNAFSICYEGPELFSFHILVWWHALIIASGTAIIVALVVWFGIVPWQRRRITGLLESQAKNPEDESGAKAASGNNVMEMKAVAGNSDVPKYEKGKEDSRPNDKRFTGAANEALEDEVVDQAAVNGDVNKNVIIATGEGDNEEEDDFREGPHRFRSLSIASISELAEHHHTKEWKQANKSFEDPPAASHLFSFLQILTAVFGAFAHGANDVSNAIGPLIALWLLYANGAVEGDTPFWILVYGGFGICLGLWVWGRRVIETVGEDLTKIVPSSGFTIEIGAATTVLVASNIGVPVSTTHCKVGSIVFVGLARSREAVDWTLFRNIGFAWIVTVPASGLISALLMYLLSFTV